MIIWTCKKFDELSPSDLYYIMQIRNAVFVVEQQCPYQDADNKDPKCYHLTGHLEHNVIAYARILPAGLAFEEASIGRVATATTTRGSGAGKALLGKAIGAIYTLYGRVPVRIGAQLYLQRFYESFDFVQAGPVYLEDGIQHIEMLLR